MRQSREITTHHINEANRELKIIALGAPGPGGAAHLYEIGGFVLPGGNKDMADCVALHFQNGAIKEAGVNGITHEALIAVLLDRLTAFQDGPYRCEDNAEAIKHLVLASSALGNRTAARTERGVEGTMKV